MRAIVEQQDFLRADGLLRHAHHFRLGGGHFGFLLRAVEGESVHLINEQSVGSGFTDAFANGFRPPGAESGFQNIKHRNASTAHGLAGFRIEKQERPEGFSYDLLAENLGFGRERIGIGRVKIEQAACLGVDFLEACDLPRRSELRTTQFLDTVALLDAEEIRTDGDAAELGIVEEAVAIAKHLIDRHLVPRERGAYGACTFGGMRRKHEGGENRNQGFHHHIHRTGEGDDGDQGGTIKREVLALPIK